MNEPPFHLILETDEREATASGVRLLISDEAHEPRIRQLAREVLTKREKRAKEEVLANVGA